MTKYSQFEIDKIISRGSVKQKARLFVRDRMGYHGTGFIMSYDDIERLTQSVQENDRDKWDELTSFGLRLENGFKDLALIVKNVTRDRNNLQSTLRTLRDFEILEEAVNSLMYPSEYYKTGPNPKYFLEYRYLNPPDIPTGLSLVSPTRDEEGFVDFHLTGEGSLSEKAMALRDSMRQSMKTYLCYEYAMRERFKELHLDIPEYEETLERFRKEIEIPVSLSLRFEGVQDNRTYQVGECNLKDREPKEYPFPAVRDRVEDYSVRVSDIDLTTNENKEFINTCYSQI